MTFRPSRVPALLLAFLFGSLGACGDSGGPSGPDSDNAIASLTVSPSTATVPVGSSVQFKAEARNGRGETMGVVVSWSSSSASVATVGSSGTVTGVSIGDATISASAGGITGTASVSVLEPLAVATAELPVGFVGVPFSAALEATGGDGDYAWALLGGSVPPGLTVSGSGAVAGTPTQAGASFLTVEVRSGDGQTATTQVIAAVSGCGGPAAEEAPAAVALAPGEARRLTDQEAACFRTAPATGSRYLLAYADTRLVEKARTGPEWPWPDSLDVGVADQSPALPAAAQQSVTLQVPEPPEGIHAPAPSLPLPGAPAAAPAPDPVPSGCPFLNSWFPFCRATPWTLGEAVTHYPAADTIPPGEARVVAVQGNLVVSVFLPDSSLLAPGTIAKVDSILGFLAARGVSLYQDIFGLSGPSTTSDESGQLWIAIEADLPGSTSGSYADPVDGRGRWGRILMGIQSPYNVHRMADIPAPFLLGGYAREVFQTYQFRWRYETAPPWRTYLGTPWGVDGGAFLVATELTREFLNVPFLGNQANDQAYTTDDPMDALAAYYSSISDLTRGYGHAASFLRDLVQRLVVGGGLGFDEAMGEVLTGAMEGWWGINEEGLHPGPGLTDRMRARLGPGWNPADALLDWTMSAAADDLTSNPTYQNLTVRSYSPSTETNPMRPHGVVENGARFEVRRAAGNTGVFELAGGPGGFFSASSAVAGEATDAVEWLLLRIQ